jgi:dolichyl-phosphate beta-glucosyltransferase
MWEGIKLFIATWPAPCEFIIVDDGSTDNTANKIRDEKLFKDLAHDRRASLLLQENTGKGGALARGVAAAQMQYILTLDADMATMPTELLKWLQYEPGMYAQGSRVHVASRTHAHSVLQLISSRRSSGKVFNKIVRAITGLRHTDTQCGFKLYPTGIAQDVFSNLRVQGWAHDVEILLSLHRKSIVVVEMPVSWNEQDASKIRVVRDGISMLVQLFHIRFGS